MNERDYFYSDTCYRRYLYFKKYTDKVNELINAGYLVFYEGDLLSIENKFIYEDGEILLPFGNCRFTLCGGVYSDNCKLYLLENQFSKKEIDRLFKEDFKVVKPESIISLKDIL